MFTVLFVSPWTSLIPLSLFEYPPPPPPRIYHAHRALQHMTKRITGQADTHRSFFFFFFFLNY